MAEVTLTLEEYEALRDMAMGIAAPIVDTVIVKPVKRKVSAASKRYGKAFKKVAPKFKLKNGSWKKNGFKLAVRAAHKLAKTNRKL
tara:strand:- start:247 stop:504 length:258 start_codon:yes stop_codon:yes gene_type:complete